MNKMMVIIALIIAALLINAGLVLNQRIANLLKQKEKVMSRNISMLGEINQKQMFKKRGPLTVSRAFAMLVNQTKILEIYSGIRMKIVFSDAREDENMEDQYIETTFRKVKALPLTINVDQFSDETDKVEILNDINLLENCTDFQVSAISTENNALTVKGELYGI